MSQYDLGSLYDFLTQTPENGLRKMFVDGKPMTEIHFNILIKTIRACTVEQFAEHVEKKDLPKVKLNANEIKLKESFWNVCFETFQSRGILNPASAVKVAPPKAA